MPGIYHQIISEATGITDPRQLLRIEEVMRHDIFHSTLDWQTKEELEEAAKTAVTVLNELECA